MFSRFTWLFGFYKPGRVAHTTVLQVSTFYRMSLFLGRCMNVDRSMWRNKTRDIIYLHEKIWGVLLVSSVPIPAMLAWCFLELCGDAQCTLWKKAWEMWQPVTVLNKCFGPRVLHSQWWLVAETIIAGLCIPIKQALKHLVLVICDQLEGHLLAHHGCTLELASLS